MLAGPAQAATAHRKNVINPICNDLVNIDVIRILVHSFLQEKRREVPK